MSFLLPVDEDLSLRLIEPRHAPEIYDAVDGSREHIGRWMNWVEKTRSVDDTRAFCERAVREFAEGKQWAVSVLERGRVVGGTGWTDWVVHDPDKTGLTGASADIGYWLTEEAQGRGIMTRCVRVLLDHAFGDHGIHRITIHAEPDNQRSWGVAERLGFTLEGTMRHICRWDGRWVSHRLYSMLADEWPEKRSPL